MPCRGDTLETLGSPGLRRQYCLWRLEQSIFPGYLTGQTMTMTLLELAHAEDLTSQILGQALPAYYLESQERQWLGKQPRAHRAWMWYQTRLCMSKGSSVLESSEQHCEEGTTVTPVSQQENGTRG